VNYIYINLVTVRNLVIVNCFLFSTDNLYILVHTCTYLYTDVLTYVTTPFGSTEHEMK
jgi:hypothetical protein